MKLVTPHDPFPCKIPRTMFRLFCHITSTVVTIGGEAGTMGWVDLWHGILLCDVLDPNPTLRGVPLPLPMELLAQNSGLGTDIGCPKSLRGISFVPQSGSQGGCLRFVHLEATTTMVPLPSCAGSDSDDEILGFDWEMRDWAITTWSNYKMTTSLDDWEMDCKKTEASKTSIVSSKLKSKMLKSGLLSTGGTESGEPKRGLQNLYVSHPAPGMDNGVVYLQARVKFQDAKAFVLALDTNNNQLLAAAEFATETICRTGIKHLPCNISKYIDPQDRVSRIPKGTFASH